MTKKEMNKALTYILDNKKRPIWLRAFRQWQRRPPTLAPLAETAQHCASCGNDYQGNYCPRCGQSATVGRFSFKNALKHFLDVWGMGNRSMFRSLRDLTLRPGYLIRDYIGGMQSAYFPPFKMFFVLAAIALLVEHGINLNPNDYVENENGQVVTERVDEKDQVSPDDQLEEDEIVVTTDNEENENKTVMYYHALRFAKFMDSMLEKNPAIFSLITRLLFSWPLFFFIRRSPTIPDLRYSEFVITLVYTSNSFSIFSIAGDLLGLVLLRWLAFIMVFVALKQFSGYSMKRLLGYIILTLIVSVTAFAVVSGIIIYVLWKIG